MQNFVLNNSILFSSFFSSFSCDVSGRPIVADYVPSLPASLTQMIGNTMSEISLNPENLFIPIDSKGLPVYIAEYSDYDIFFRTRSLLNELCFMYDSKLSNILINRGYVIDPEGENLIRFYFGPLDSTMNHIEIEDLFQKIVLSKPIELNSNELELSFRLSSTRETGLIDERLHRCFIDVVLNHVNSLSSDCSSNDFCKAIKILSKNSNNKCCDLDFYKTVAQELYVANFGSEQLDHFLSNMNKNGLAFSVCSKLDLNFWLVDFETGMGSWSQTQPFEAEYNSFLIELYLNGLTLGPAAYENTSCLNYILGSERFPLGQSMNRQILVFKDPEVDPEFERYTLVHKTVAGTMVFFAFCWVLGTFIIR